MAPPERRTQPTTDGRSTALAATAPTENAQAAPRRGRRRRHGATAVRLCFPGKVQAFLLGAAGDRADSPMACAGCRSLCDAAGPPEVSPCRVHASRSDPARGRWYDPAAIIRFTEGPRGQPPPAGIREGIGHGRQVRRGCGDGTVDGGRGRSGFSALCVLSGTRRGQSDHSRGRVLLAARPLGLRQDDAAADHRRSRPARRGRHPDRRRRRQGDPGAQAPRQHGLPVLRPLPAPQRARQRRLRPADEEGAASARSPPGSTRRWRWCRSPRFADRKPGAALGRAEAAGGPGPGAHQRAQRAAARRAARRARSQAPQGAPGRAARAAEQRRHHFHLRHPRSGRGAGPVAIALP